MRMTQGIAMSLKFKRARYWVAFKANYILL